jgi:protein TonB
MGYSWWLDFTLSMSPHRHRIPFIVASVVLLHGLGLWGLQSGLLQRVSAVVQELVVPVWVLTEPPVAPPSPPKPVPPVLPSKTPPAAPAPPVAPAPTARPLAATQAVAMPQAIADPTPSANAATGQAQAPTAVVAPAAAPTAPAKVELPSSSADYLHNPKPPYPKLSERRGEQGVVLLSVLVGADGHAREVSVKTSSGYERLDAAAREAVLAWTFVPGKRNGAAVEMSVDVPIRFKPSE